MNLNFHGLITPLNVFLALVVLFLLYVILSLKRRLSKLEMMLERQRRDEAFKAVNSSMVVVSSQKDVVKLAKKIKKLVEESYLGEKVTTYTELLDAINSVNMPIDLRNALISFFNRVIEIEYADVNDASKFEEISRLAGIILKRLGQTQESKGVGKKLAQVQQPA